MALPTAIAWWLLWSRPNHSEGATGPHEFGRRPPADGGHAEGRRLAVAMLASLCLLDRRGERLLL
jgi:hypothetical protein